MENQKSTKNQIRLINKLNEAIGSIASVIFQTFKLSSIILIITLIAFLLISSAKSKMDAEFGFIMLLGNILITIYQLYSIFQLASKLKNIENENNTSILEILQHEKD